MSVNRRTIRRIVSGVLILWALPAGAQVEHLGGHFRENEEFSKVLDARCTVCHTRDRVDAAFRERRDLQAIQERMLEHGAVLDERDKKVLGTFWGNALKEKEKK